MRTIDLQRKFDLTEGEVEDLRRRLGGTFHIRHGIMVPQYGGGLVKEFTSDWVGSPNIVTNEGINDNLEAYLNGGTQITTWYLTMFTDNVTPLATHTAAAPGVTEIALADVAESVRETYNANTAASQSIDNVAGPVAQYTADQTFTGYGAMLIGGGTSAFGNGAGVLWCSSLFGASKPMVALDTIDITYTINGADA